MLLRLFLANFQQVKAECLDLRQDAVQRRLIQDTPENGDWTLLLANQRRESRQQRGAQVPADADRVQCWAHAAIVGLRRVSRHRRDLVIARQHEHVR
jgi:hypothetical protein